MNKKILVTLVLLLVFSFATQVFASLTFTTDTITGTTDSTIDLGAGNDLSLQTTGSNITIGTDTTLGSKLSIDASGTDTTPLIIKTNGSVGNYTQTNSAIFIKDAAGTEILRIFASDPDVATHYNANNLYIGREAGLNQPTDNASAGYFNTGIGGETLYSNTTGSNNSANGFKALRVNTTGGNNTASGSVSLVSNTTGSYNTASGQAASYSNTTGSSNSAFGVSAIYSNTTGSFNTAIGRLALTSVTGSNNVAIGYSSGESATPSGQTPNNTSDYSVYIGVSTKALADDDQNEIVIGYNATGLGSNSVRLGNDSITITALMGNVGIGTTTPTNAKLVVLGGVAIDTDATNNKISTGSSGSG